MSLESALDEERREVMALLEGRSIPRAGSRQRTVAGRTASPAGIPQSPVRSMLDIGGGPSARHASIAGTGVGITSPPTSAHTKSPTSPTFIRSMLDATGSPPATRTGLPSSEVLGSPKLNPESAYQFEMLPTIEAHAMPKRVTQGGKKKSSMAAVFGSGDIPDPIRRDRNGRHNSTAGILGKHKSQSPSSRIPGGRSASPGSSMLNTNSMNLMSTPGKYVTDSGKIIDLNSAYRRLSDAALLRSEGALSKAPVRKGSDPTKGLSTAPDGSTRLQKDYYDDAEDEAALESSDDDEEDTSGDEGWGGGKSRGRRRHRNDDDQESSPEDERNRLPKSLLAAAEQERKDLSSYKVKSLLDEPTFTVTGPDGENSLPYITNLNKRPGVHPNTAFDVGGSGVSTPVNSDTEADLNEIRKAQKLSLTVSPMQSTPAAHRCLRQIIRGDYAAMQREAEQGLRRQRVYLVATDLSDESAYALEWTIGTVLRDGDTLLAVYAVDEETGTGEPGGGVQLGEGASAFKDTAQTLSTLGVGHRDHGTPGESPGPSPLHNQVNASEAQPDLSGMSKSERERWHACQEVTDRCVKLLRKTKLQCRVVVEVFHCKSPKHMITEVIDFLEPTLVILGSRGRSALKGVLLGSFSNYLVTKSSVPVMVARKRLRKHSKFKRSNVRLSNVLTNPTARLASAKID